LLDLSQCVTFDLSELLDCITTLKLFVLECQRNRTVRRVGIVDFGYRIYLLRIRQLCNFPLYKNTHTHTHAHTRTRTHTRTRARTRAHTRAHARTRAHTHTHTTVHTHTHTHTQYTTVHTHTHTQKAVVSLVKLARLTSTRSTE